MRILFGTLVGALVLYIWGFVSWTVLPWHNATIPDMPDERIGVTALRGIISESGVYRFPGYGHAPGAKMSAQQEEVYKQKSKTGPVGLVFINKEGVDLDDPTPFFANGVLVLLQAFLASLMLGAAGARLTGYPVRVLFVTAIGAIAALGTHLTLWNWWALPASYSLVMAADLVAGWLLAGIFMAAIVKHVREG